MIKRVCSVLLIALFLLSCSCALAESEDRYGRYDETIELNTVRSMNSTIVFDESDPEKTSFDQNRYNDTFLEKLNIKLTHKWISADGDSDIAKWSAAIASGDVPDFAAVDSKVYKMLVEAGLVADMTDVIQEYGSERYLSSLTETHYNQMTFNGRVLGFPQATPAMNYGGVLFIRKDWLDKLNIEVPETIEEVIAAARAFREAKLGGDDTVGLLLGDGMIIDNGRWDGFLNAYGAYANIWLERDGKLAYSNVQPEMKDALLSLQKLYADGVTNKDVAVANQDVCSEYISSGKVGLFYGTSHVTTTSLDALHANFPESEVISLLPVVAEGKDFKVQTDMPSSRFIFVSKKCEHPEAVIKMSNLTMDLFYEDYENYGTDSSGFMWFKYMPWGGWSGATSMEMAQAYGIQLAEENNDFTLLDANNGRNVYNNYLLAKKGESQNWWLTTFGKGGSYTLFYQAYNEGKLLVNAYSGLPTETQSILGDVVNDELETAIMEVVLGADISVYENAVEAWLANGGEQITAEVNEWYDSVLGR